VLTAGAGLLMTSFLKLTHSNEGFNPDHVLRSLSRRRIAVYEDAG